MLLTKAQTRELYRRRAGGYDAVIWLYRLAGFRERTYRHLTVAALDLKPGDLVVDIGCGTGLNFSFLERAVGPQGRIVGIDLTDSMLAQARDRASAEGWTNVEFVESDAATFNVSRPVDGILSTFAITLIPEYDKVIQRGADALGPGGRLAIFDLKQPERWPMWLVRLAAWANKPYGVSLELTDHHPWESVRRHLKEVLYREFYYGALYLSVGERRVENNAN